MSAHDERIVRMGGAACVIGGLIGAIGALVVGMVDPAVPDTQLSYPFEPATFRITQALWTVGSALVFAGILALARSGAAGPGGPPRRAMTTSVVSLGVQVPTQLSFAFFATSSSDDVPAVLLGSLMGLTSLLAGIGLTTVGIATLRAPTWSGWRRATPVLAGAFPIAILVPSFAIFGWNPWAISGWFACLTLLGVALYQEHGTEGREPVQELRIP